MAGVASVDRQSLRKTFFFLKAFAEHSAYQHAKYFNTSPMSVLYKVGFTNQLPQQTERSENDGYDIDMIMVL